MPHQHLPCPKDKALLSKQLFSNQYSSAFTALVHCCEKVHRKSPEYILTWIHGW